MVCSPKTVTSAKKKKLENGRWLLQELEHPRDLEIPVFAKKTSLPNFDPRVYFGVENGATDAEKHGESEFRAKIVPTPPNNSKWSHDKSLKRLSLPE